MEQDQILDELIEIIRSAAGPTRQDLDRVVRKTAESQKIGFIFEQWLRNYYGTTDVRSLDEADLPDVFNYVISVAHLMERRARSHKVVKLKSGPDAKSNRRA